MRYYAILTREPAVTESATLLLKPEQGADAASACRVKFQALASV